MGLLIRVVNEGGYIDVGAGSVCIYICIRCILSRSAMYQVYCVICFYISMMSIINMLNCGICII